MASPTLDLPQDSDLEWGTAVAAPRPTAGLPDQTAGKVAGQQRLREWFDLAPNVRVLRLAELDFGVGDRKRRLPRLEMKRRIERKNE
jgi:hypothetical protein